MRPLRRRRSFPWLLIGALVVLAAPVAGVIAAGVAVEQAERPPTCEGIGWGCEPGPGASAALVLVIVYAPFVAGVAAVVGLLELGGARTAVARLVVASLAVAVVVVGTLVALGSVLLRL